MSEEEKKEKPEGYVFGRPTKYKPEYCQKVIEMGEYGASFAEMCLELNVCKNTFLSWQKEHTDFLNAVSHARHLAQGWWEKNGRLRTFNDKGFNAYSYSFNMRNRFPDDWSETTKVETSTSEKNIVDARKREQERIKHEQAINGGDDE